MAVKEMKVGEIETGGIATARECAKLNKRTTLSISGMIMNFPSRISSQSALMERGFTEPNEILLIDMAKIYTEPRNGNPTRT